MNIGDIVLYRGKFAEVITELPKSVVLETGISTAIVSKEFVEPAFKIGDQVYLKGANKSFVIDEFYFRPSSGEWIAIPKPNSMCGFHPPDTREIFLLSTLEFPIRISL